MVNLLKALNLFNCISEVIAQDAAHWNHRDSLAEHDKKYHGGMFKGGRCLFRQKGDGADILGVKNPGMGRGSDAGTMTPQDEYDAVVARYKGTPLWMKAPNGKPTNLTERQWVQVRTPSFKKWFGDWEKKCEVEAAKSFLLNHEAEVSITGDEFQRDGRKLTDKVPEFFMREYGGYAISPEFGRVELDREGVKSDLGHGMRSEKAAAFAAVHDVIEKGFVYNRAQNWKGRGWDSAVIGAPIKIGKDDYICEVVIQKLPNRQGFYLHEVELKEKVEDAFKTHTKVGAPPISRLIVSKLSDEINRDADKISKVVDENGEPRVVWHETDWKISKDNSAFRIDDDDVAWFSDSQSRKGYEHGENAYRFFLNLKNPKMIEDESYFACEMSGDGLDKSNDGAIFRNTKTGRMVFSITNPNQVKSATDNSGAFSNDEVSTLDEADAAEKAAEKYLRTVEDESLAEHDKKYHGGMFKGGRCLFRQKGDGADILGVKNPGMGRGSDAGTMTPQDEYDSVVAKYKGTPMWMKAPNGKPTNLTERQWVQVRTPSFKKWFGDWENYVLGRATEDQCKDAVRKWREDRVEFRNSESGRVAELKSDWSKLFSAKAKGESDSFEAHYAAVMALNRLFEKSVRMWDEKPRNDSADIAAYAKYGQPFVFNGETYLAKMTVKEYAPRVGIKDGFYSIEAVSVEKINVAGNNGDISVKGRILDRDVGDIIAKRIAECNGVSKVVDENGEPMVVFHGSDEIRTEFKMRGGAMGKGAYFTTAFPEAADYVREKLGEPDLSEDECEGYITECFLNVRDENNISSSSYGYGEYIVLATDPTQIKSATNNSGAFSPDEMSTLDGADAAEKAAEEYLRKVAARG